MFNLSPVESQHTAHKHTAYNSARYLFSALFALMLAGLAGTPALASGSVGGGLSSGAGVSAPREVDEVYEYGKAIYLGRTPGSQKIKYCVKVDGEVKKLRGRTLRDFRGGKQIDFANALYDCKQPEKLALLGVDKEQVAYVLYYLNKRYKLDLASSRS